MVATMARQQARREEEAWEAALKEYGGKARTFARNSYRQMPGYTQKDVEQEMLVVLWKCVKTFAGKQHGTCFNTYFQSCAKYRVIDLVRYFKTKSRTAEVVSIEEMAGEVCLDLSAEELVFMRITVMERVEEEASLLAMHPKTGAKRAAELRSAAHVAVA